MFDFLLRKKDVSKNSVEGYKDPILKYFEPRFEVYHDEHFKGWGIMYQTDKTMDEDWLVLNKDGDLRGYFTLEHKKHYYPSEELATKAMKEFIVQRCVEEYEYLLRRDLLSIWGDQC